MICRGAPQALLKLGADRTGNFTNSKPHYWVASAPLEFLATLGKKEKEKMNHHKRAEPHHSACCRKLQGCWSFFVSAEKNDFKENL